LKIVCENEKQIQPKADVDSKPKKMPIKNTRQKKENQWLKEPSENQPSRGDELPTIVSSKFMKSTYDELCQKSMIDACTLY
jgi:hypothetical protein